MSDYIYSTHTNDYVLPYGTYAGYLKDLTRPGSPAYANIITTVPKSIYADPIYIDFIKKYMSHVPGQFATEIPKELLKEGSPVSYNDDDYAVNTADEQLDKARRDKLATERLAEKEAALAAIGDEPADVKFVTFSKQLASHKSVSTFVAVRDEDGRWVSVSDYQNTYSFDNWHNMALWLVKGPHVTNSITPLRYE